MSYNCVNRTNFLECFYALSFRMDHAMFKCVNDLFDYSIVGIYMQTIETISPHFIISKQRMRMNFFFIIFMTLMVYHVDTAGICSCYCCRTDSCLSTYVGSFYIGDICNSITCNQNLCFAFNGTQCPAYGSPGIAIATCSSAYSIFNHFNLFLFFAIRLFFQ